MQDGAATITFFDRTYEEAFDLLVEARDFLAERQRRPEALAPAVQLVASSETLRLTTRLVQVMAWLLVQRAVRAGELDAAEADAPRRRLGGHEVCADAGPWDVSELPPALRSLLDRSQALYNRVARLDEMVHIRASQARARAEAAMAEAPIILQGEDSGSVPV